MSDTQYKIKVMQAFEDGAKGSTHAKTVKLIEVLEEDNETG